MGKVFAMKKVQMHCKMCAFVNCSLQGGLGLKGAKENRPPWRKAAEWGIIQSVYFIIICWKIRGGEK